MGPGDIDADAALFLDVDGTLLEFADTPEQVAVPSALPPLLADLAAKLGGALAIISGRPIASIDRLWPPLLLPAAGQHGAEWRISAAGPVVSPAPHPATACLQDRVRDLARGRAGLRVEAKPHGVVLHYAGEAGDLAARMQRILAEIDLPDLQLLTARRALEVKSARFDKGRAIRRFLAHPPFSGRTPVYLGDDITDEDGFGAVIDAGGWAVRVGPEPRPSRAPCRLGGPSEARAWLAAQARGLEKETPL